MPRFTKWTQWWDYAVMSRRWLATLSYSYSDEHGYQTDPYKIISIVDPASGQPPSRSMRVDRICGASKAFLRQQSPFGRRRHICLIAGFKDDWGIKSLTADLRYRWQIDMNYYIEPHLRYYTQSAADFFHYYLGSGEVILNTRPPIRDSRVPRANLWRQIRVPFNETSELNLRVEYYDEHGNGSPAGAIGQLQQQNLFPI